MVKRNHISLNTHYILILITCGSAFERLTFYAFNGSIAACWGGAIDIDFMDSPLHTCGIEPHHALNNFITIIWWSILIWI